MEVFDDPYARVPEGECPKCGGLGHGAPGLPPCPLDLWDSLGGVSPLAEVEVEVGF